MNINCQLCKHRRDLHDGTTGHCHAPDCTCPGQTACVLCHVPMPPFSGHDTTEGMLCNDASGCRRRALAQGQQLLGALKAICTTNDSGPWIEVYRAAGGGYEGLQAIAATALVQVGLNAQ